MTAMWWLGPVRIRRWSEHQLAVLGDRSADEALLEVPGDNLAGGAAARVDGHRVARVLSAELGQQAAAVGRPLDRAEPEEQARHADPGELLGLAAAPVVR